MEITACKLENEIKYRKLFENARDAILVMTGYTFTECNEKTLDMFGVSRDQIIGQPPYRFSPPLQPDGRDSKMKALEKINAALAGQPQFFEWKHSKLDGTTFDTEVSLNRIELNKQIYIQVVVRDISERKRIEKQIQESELSLQAVLQSTAEGVLAISNEGKVLFSNDRFAEIWRIPPEIIATKDDKTLLRFVADQLIAPEIFIQKVQELYKSKEKSFDELYFKDGRVFERLSQSLMRGMTLSGRVWVFRNITERRKIEDGLKKAHEELNKLTIELKSAALVKSQFLTNMSHELRTPLNSINGFSEVLYEETFGPLNEKQKNYVNYILTSGRHLLLLINQILDIAKVEAKKMKLNLSSLPIKKLLNDISMLLADMVSKKKIEMLLEIPEDLPNIEGDELRVKEIIYNLLSNAVKFTPEGGKIGIRAKKTDSEIEIVVWDTGIGIAPENMNKLFEGFFRADTPYSRVTEGTGLGLPLSKKLVELHNGKFSIESGGLNKGTQVKFTLPIISKKEV